MWLAATILNSTVLDYELHERRYHIRLTDDYILNI